MTSDHLISPAHTCTARAAGELLKEPHGDDRSRVWPSRPSSWTLSVSILMSTVMAKLVVTSIVEERRVHVELQAALFDMKQAVESVAAASRLVPLARRRAPPRLAAARSTC